MEKYLCIVVDRLTFAQEYSVLETAEPDTDLILEEEINRLTTNLDRKMDRGTMPYWATCKVTITPEEQYPEIVRNFRDFCKNELAKMEEPRREEPSFAEMLAAATA